MNASRSAAPWPGLARQLMMAVTVNGEASLSLLCAKLIGAS
jgi:hypothetical protein